MDVYLEKGGRNMKRKSILIGGAVAGVIAMLCALALANTLKRPEKRT
jgi:gas vesicle protein